MSRNKQKKSALGDSWPQPQCAVLSTPFLVILPLGKAPSSCQNVYPRNKPDTQGVSEAAPTPTAIRNTRRARNISLPSTDTLFVSSFSLSFSMACFSPVGWNHRLFRGPGRGSLATGPSDWLADCGGEIECSVEKTEDENDLCIVRACLVYYYVE
ncbi:hypothetical protein GGI35DRAFT_109172 [Trichoderma velutinum]